jgi:hypothetical protein
MRSSLTSVPTAHPISCREAWLFHHQGIHKGLRMIYMHANLCATRTPLQPNPPTSEPEVCCCAWLVKAQWGIPAVHRTSTSPLT